jgi:hypothetical protein
MKYLKTFLSTKSSKYVFFFISTKIKKSVQPNADFERQRETSNKLVPLLFHFLECLEFLLFQTSRSKRFSEDE